MRNRLSVITIAITATVAGAQPGTRGPVTNFPQFGGVNGEQFQRSNISLHATQLVNELNTVRTLLAGPRVPQIYKPSLATVANAAVQQGENLRNLAKQNANRQQLMAADGPLDAAMQQLATQAARFTQFAPGLSESLQRLDHTEQQLHAAIHQGGGGGGGGVIPPPNPDFQLQRVRRLSDSLQNQTESLRDLANNSNDGTPVGRSLELAARSLSFRASRFEKNADSVNAVLQLHGEFGQMLNQWRNFETAMRGVRVGRDFRLAATHTENTLRNIGDLIPTAQPWDYGGGFVPPLPGPGPGPVIPPINPGIGFLNRGALVIGAGEGGGPRVRLFTDLSGEAIYDFFAYDMNFVGGVRVATADLNGDNVPDLVVAPGPGLPPLVRVFDGRSMRLLTEFYAFDVAWTGGVFVAAADRTRNGQSWVAVSADVGAGPHVKVFDISTGRELDSFFAFDQRLRSGCRIALGDVNGDGTPDVIAAAGPGMEPRVRVYDGRNRNLMGDFLAFDNSFQTGLTVDSSDLTRNGRADIIVGTDAGSISIVRVFDATNARRIGEMIPFPRGFAGGVRVAGYDFDGDGVPDVVCSPGRDGNFGAQPIRVYSGVNARAIGEFYPFGPQFRGGSYIGSR